MEKEEKYQISYQNYDFLFKNALEVFKDQTFDFLGVNYPKIVKAERTEYKEIETKTDMMDLNFLLEDGTVLQLEEEVSISLEDMIRFARYNMMLYQQYRTDIHSLILTMDKNQKEEERLDTGSLKFEPEIINLGKWDGDRNLKELKEKIRNGEEINELELIFLPVMDTKEDKTVYIKEIIEIEKSLSREEKKKEQIIAMTLVAGNKFLETEILDKIWEEVKMLAILEYAEDKGVKKGIEKKAKDDALKMLEDGLSYEKIAYYTDLSIEEIQELESKIKE